MRVGGVEVGDEGAGRAQTSRWDLFPMISWILGDATGITEWGMLSYFMSSQ